MIDLSYERCNDILNKIKSNSSPSEKDLIEYYSHMSGVSSHWINAIDAIRGMLIRHYYYGNNMIA